MTLPTEKTTPNSDISKLKFLIYGESKIGKSTFCSYFDKALFISTEPTLSHLSVYEVRARSWADVGTILAEVEKGNHEFKTIILDTLDQAYEMCRNYILTKNNIKHESDLSYGKGWKLVTTEFMRVMAKLINLNYGIILIGHQVIETINKQNNDRSYNIFKIALPASTLKSLVTLLDIILYATLSNKQRIFQTTNNRYYEAGNRFNLPTSILMDYKVFMDIAKEAFISNVSNLAVPILPEVKTSSNDNNLFLDSPSLIMEQSL